MVTSSDITLTQASDKIKQCIRSCRTLTQLSSCKNKIYTFQDLYKDEDKFNKVNKVSTNPYAEYLNTLWRIYNSRLLDLEGY